MEKKSIICKNQTLNTKKTEIIIESKKEINITLIKT
jgi:hypothetical protein